MGEDGGISTGARDLLTVGSEIGGVLLVVGSGARSRNDTVFDVPLGRRT